MASHHESERQKHIAVRAAQGFGIGLASIFTLDWIGQLHSSPGDMFWVAVATAVIAGS